MPNGDPVLLGVPYTEKGLFEEELINCLSDSGDKYGPRLLYGPGLALFLALSLTLLK